MSRRCTCWCLLILTGLSLLACKNPSSNTEVRESASLTSLFDSQHDDLISIDITQSVVKWKGNKLLGTGSHEGTVKFKSGELHFSENQLAGGKFTVDMKSIYNTDIPLSDPVPRRNITTHLNSDFETEQFPTASFAITQVSKMPNSQFQITGELNIKGVTNAIMIMATEEKHRKNYTSSITFNRHDWKIGESGSWLEQKVVDDEVTIEVNLILSKN